METWMLLTGLAGLGGAALAARFAPGLVWTAVISFVWAGMMFQLLRSDLVWEAGQAPTPAGEAPAGYTESFTLYSERSNGRRTELGQALARHEVNRTEKLSVVSSDLKLKALPGLGAGDLTLQSQMRRRFDGRMDGFETEVILKDFRFKIVGTVTAGHCLTRVESPLFVRRPTFRFALDESVTVISQQLQNFSLMPDLRVGQSWHVRMIDVQALLLAVLKDSKRFVNDKASDDAPVEMAEMPFENHLAEVVRRDVITWCGRKHAVNVVEIHKAGSRSQSLRSYVDDEGRVLRQEMDGFGSRLIVERNEESVGGCLFRPEVPAIPHLFREYRGRKVWFSTRAYRSQWDALPDEEKQRMLHSAPPN